MNPSNFVTDIKNKAKTINRHIVYPDSLDERAIRAARICVDEKIARITLVGKTDAIKTKAAEIKISLDGIGIVDPETSPDFEKYWKIYYDLRKSKGMTEEQAKTTLRNSLYFGVMMVREGVADGSLAGSISTTGDVMRSGIQIIGVSPGISIVSSFFLMVFPQKIYSFADCAVVPDPTAEQLADIAISTAINHEKVTGEKAKVAMLSFSTKGSAEHPLIDKVRQATEFVKKKRPDILVDGEMQFDAAIVPSIGKKKAPQSPVAGDANVLIFPDLNSGNIGYKIAQRLAGAEVVGPVVQGLQKPAFDLSRGCSVEDIVSTTAINCVIGAA